MPILYDDNVPLDNKQLRIYDNENNYIRVSVDEAIARGLNSWKGWKCSAGVRGLYIDYDGNIWVGNCASTLLERFNFSGWKKFLNDFRFVNRDTSTKLFAEKEKDLMKEFQMSGKGFRTFLTLKEGIGNYWGFLGNIYEGMDIPDEFVTCGFNKCGCGADVILSKYKDEKYKSFLEVTNKGYGVTNKIENYKKQINDTVVATEMNFPIPYQILWDISRRCNYDCSYCWPNSHNNNEEFPTLETIIKVIDMIIDNWSGGDEIRWNFGGGEPTMHPQFLDIVKYLKEKKQWVCITTNGSRSSKFWKEACQYINTINMSAHFASMDLYTGNEQRFIKNCEIIMDYHDKVDDDFWLEIKLMTPPGYLDRAMKFKSLLNSTRLLERGANGRMKGCCSLVPIRDDSELTNYSPQELEVFKRQ